MKEIKPHDIDTEMSSELKEEGLHLLQIRSITVGIQERKSGKRVLPEGCHNLVPALGVQQLHVHILVRRHAGEAQPPVLVSENIVNRQSLITRIILSVSVFPILRPRSPSSSSAPYPSSLLFSAIPPPSTEMETSHISSSMGTEI
nr:hypothetical protein CR513_57329 [Ipomoea trifida]